MTIKRLILALLTPVVIFLIGASLLDSWTKPQIQSQLELYQTDLLLQASAWHSEGDNLDSARNALVGDDPIKNSLEQYQEVRQSAQTTLEQLNQTSSPLAPVSKTSGSESPSPQGFSKGTESELNPELRSAPVRPSPEQKLRRLINQLDLRSGILHAQLGQTDIALKTWTNLINQPSTQTGSKQLVETTEVLIGLWSNPPRLLPDAEQQIQQNLAGWFRDQALAQLYQLQQRQDALTQLQTTQQEMAESALLRLVIIGGLPALGSLTGLGLILVWVGQQVTGRKRPQSQLSKEAGWSVPWGGETVWQVMVLWFIAFFGVSLILIPLAVQLLGINPAAFGGRAQALLALLNYGTVVVAGLSILYLCLKPFLPLPDSWVRLDWRGSWVKWGLGGYLAALPLVIVISLLNQRLLQSHGGGNPLLDIILQSQDGVTIVVLFLMVAVLAPFFEETLFRGFFLPSLTRYLPAWGAIAVSALVFAIAHLSLSDILPLTVLGAVLGYVCLQSRNLLSSILLHSIWNSGSLLALLILGSGPR